MPSCLLGVLVIAAFLLAGIDIVAAGPDGQGFSSPNAAATVVVNAVKSGGMDSLMAVLGPSAKSPQRTIGTTAWATWLTVSGVW